MTSGLLVKPSIVDNPSVFRPAMAMTQAMSTTPLIAQLRVEFRVTPPAMRPHRPCVAMSV